MCLVVDFSIDHRRALIERLFVAVIVCVRVHDGFGCESAYNIFRTVWFGYLRAQWFRIRSGVCLALTSHGRLRYIRAQEEVKRIQSVPLVIGQFNEAIDENSGIVGSTTGSSYYVGGPRQ